MGASFQNSPHVAGGGFNLSRIFDVRVNEGI